MFLYIVFSFKHYDRLTFFLSHTHTHQIIMKTIPKRDILFAILDT